MRVQLVHAYNAAIKRNDQALFHYGFIQEQDPPKLAAQDLPGGNLYDPSRFSEEDHSEHSPCPAALLRFPCHSELKFLPHCTAPFPMPAFVGSRGHTTTVHDIMLGLSRGR